MSRNMSCNCWNNFILGNCICHLCTAPCELRAATIAKKLWSARCPSNGPWCHSLPLLPSHWLEPSRVFPVSFPRRRSGSSMAKVLMADGGGDSCSARRPTIPTSASTVGSFSGAPFSPARPARLLFPAGAPVLATAGAQPLPISSSLLVIPWPNALATPASTPLRPPPCRSSSLSYAQTRPRPRPRPLSSSRVGARGGGSKPGAKAGSRRREAQGGQPGAGDGGIRRSGRS